VSRGPTLAVIALAVATTVGAVVFHAYSGPHGGEAYTRPVPPAPVGVFRDGGVPRRDPAIEQALARELPQFVSSLVAGGSSEAARAQRIGELREHRAFAAHGPVLTGAWRAMIDALDDWWRASSSSKASGAANELRARIDVVSDLLAASQLGYYIDPEIVSDHPRRRPGIFTYRIDEVAFVRTNEDRVRVLTVRRLDSLDAGAAMLGLTTEELADPVVLLDAVEAKVETQIVPILAGRWFPVGDDSWAYSARGRALAEAAGRAIRRELMAALYDDVQSSELATAKCKKLLVDSVRRHEAQHRLDQERGLAYPEALAKRIGEKKQAPFAIRARFELSAYLSQIASDTWTPQLTLANLARHGFRRGQRTEEAFVAVTVIEGMARRLGVVSAGSLVRRGDIDRDRLAMLLTALTTRTTVELRSAAAGLWAELFGKPLVRLYD
jgi:hypothetical protein